MKNDTLILQEGMKTLRGKLGLIEAEKFITLITESLLIIPNGSKRCGLIKQLMSYLKLQNSNGKNTWATVPTKKPVLTYQQTP